MSDVKTQLKKKIAELDALSETLPGIIIVHNLETMGIEYMSQRGLDILKTTMEDLKAMGAEYHQRFFNQEEAVEYVPRYVEFLERNRTNEVFTVMQQVRSSDNVPWEWFLSAGMVIIRDNGKPVYSVTIAQSIDPLKSLNDRVEKLIAENQVLRNNISKFSLLGKREKQILKLLAKGLKNQEIADQLYISLNTVQTHRKSIKRKLDIKTAADIQLYADAIAEI